MKKKILQVDSPEYRDIVNKLLGKSLPPVYIKISFSGNKDVDREILSKLDDRNLLQACQVNKYVWNQVCNEDFFRNRLLKMFPEIKREDVKNWKEFYLRAIYYISKMKEDYGYVYTFGDFKTQYNLLKEYGKNKSDLLIRSSITGEPSLVIWSLKNGADIHVENDLALRWASYNGNLELVKYLVSQGADINAIHDYALRYASFNGHLEVVKYLVSQGADIHANDNEALKYASRNGKLEIVEYFQSIM